MRQLLDNTTRSALGPALRLLPASMDTPEARVMLLAIGLQESRLKSRWQIVDKRRPEVRGPARGLWQFERGGGVIGVLTHPATRELAHQVCDARGITSSARPVWTWLAEDDVLAAAFARLLLWTDPKPLPALGRGGEAWALYLRTWRPGKPHASTWNGLYAQALAAVAE